MEALPEDLEDDLAADDLRAEQVRTLTGSWLGSSMAAVCMGGAF